MLHHLLRRSLCSGRSSRVADRALLRELRAAAAGGEPVAQLNLGQHILSRLADADLTADRPSALRFDSEGRPTGGAESASDVISAIRSLQLQQKRRLRAGGKQADEAVAMLRNAARQGLVEAQVALGSLCFSDEAAGSQIPAEEGLRMYELAAEAGHHDALFSLGILRYQQLEHETNVNAEMSASVESARDHDGDAALLLMRRSADMGNGGARFWLGYFHHNGDELCGVAPDINEALHFMERSEEVSHGPAATYLGRLWLTGDPGGCPPESVSADIARAVFHLERGCELGEPEAMHLLADLLRGNDNNLNVSEPWPASDLPRALALYERAGDLSHVESLLACGSMHFGGLGTDVDYDRAFGCYSRAVDLSGATRPPGDVARQMALHNLASMYFKGHGVEQDATIAARILEIAAEELGE